MAGRPILSIHDVAQRPDWLTKAIAAQTEAAGVCLEAKTGVDYYIAPQADPCRSTVNRRLKDEAAGLVARVYLTPFGEVLESHDLDACSAADLLRGLNGR